MFDLKAQHLRIYSTVLSDYLTKSLKPLTILKRFCCLIKLFPCIFVVADGASWLPLPAHLFGLWPCAEDLGHRLQDRRHKDVSLNPHLVNSSLPASGDTPQCRTDVNTVVRWCYGWSVSNIFFEKKKSHKTDLKQSTLRYFPPKLKSDQFLQVHKPVALLRRVSGAETFTSFSHHTPQPPHFIPSAALSLYVARFSCHRLRTVYPTADPPWVHPVTAEGRGHASATKVGDYTLINSLVSLGVPSGNRGPRQ